MRIFDPALLLKRMEKKGYTTSMMVTELIRLGADDIKPSTQHLRMTIKGQSMPNAKFIGYCADVLDCSVEYFYRKEE